MDFVFRKFVSAVLACALLAINFSVLANSGWDEKFKIVYPMDSKIPMHVVYPRPDDETQIHARHRWAHPNMTYEVPIGIQGGSWPFKYEIIEAPASASVGKLLNDHNYGIVSWSPQTNESSPQSFHIRITDQVNNTVDVKWMVTIDSSKFTFIQEGWNGQKVGTIDEPLESIDDWYQNDEENDDFHNQIIVFRGGSYQMNGSPNRNNNVRLRADTKTPSLIGFPNEQAVIDFSKSKVLTDGRGLNDIFIANLTIENSRQDVGNAHFFWVVSESHRATWWKNNFRNHGPGSVGNDNPAGVFISDRGTHKKNILYKQNSHDGFLNGMSNGSYVDIYFSSYVLIEENIAKNSHNKCGFWAKATTAFVSIRANNATENVSSGGICIGYGTESPLIPHDHEVSWNRIVLTNSQDSYTTLLFASENSRVGETYNSYVYRNTFVNGSAWVRFLDAETTDIERNIVVSRDLRRWGNHNTSPNRANLTASTPEDLVDLDGNLIGNAKAKYFGRAGPEVLYFSEFMKPR